MNTRNVIGILLIGSFIVLIAKCTDSTNPIHTNPTVNSGADTIYVYDPVSNLSQELNKYDKEKVKVLINYSKYITTIEPVGQLKNLKSIILLNCKQLNDVSVLSECPQLEKIFLQDLDSLKGMLKFDSLPNLKSLDISHCESIDSIKFNTNPVMLESFVATGSKGLKSIDFLSNSPHLRTLDLTWCDNITDYAQIGSLLELEYLRIAKTMGGMANYQILQPLRNLKQLIIGGSLSNLQYQTSLSFLKNMVNLIHLDMEYLDNLQSISEIGNLKNIKTLKLYGLIKINNFTPFDSLSEARALSLSGCDSLNDLPFLSKMPNLKYLTVYNCKNLTDISAISYCQGLRVVNIGYCRSLANFTPLLNIWSNGDTAEDLSGVPDTIKQQISQKGVVFLNRGAISYDPLNP